MKECPKCRTVYTDKTLSFCLSDGSVLIEEPTGAKTEVLPGGLVSPTVETQSASKTQNSNLVTDETIIRSARPPKGAGVSPFWLLSTFALLGIILAGAVVAWVLYSRSGDDSASQTDKTISIAKTSNSSTSDDANGNESEIPANSADVTPTISNTPSPSPTQSATPAEKTYKVIGVKGGDVLYMRPSPGNLKVVVGKIPPGAAGIRVVGKGRRAGKSIWVPVVYNGKRGWVNRRFLSTSK